MSSAHSGIVVLPTAFIFILLLLFRSSSALNDSCPFYGNDRVSAMEANLANCSWFGQNACCKRTEVTSVFSDMFKLYGATKACEDHMSYLMCYFCSPSQSTWFRDNNKAVICKTFCEATYEHCADADYEGQTIGVRFKNGEAFCKENFFDVGEGEKECYKFDSKPFSGQVRPAAYSELLLVSLLFILLVAVC